MFHSPEAAINLLVVLVTARGLLVILVPIIGLNDPESIMLTITMIMVRRYNQPQHRGRQVCAERQVSGVEHWQLNATAEVEQLRGLKKY